MTAEICLRVAAPADLDAIVAVHTAARSAYYRAGGLPEEEFDGPDDARLRREGWAEAIRSAEKRVVRASLNDVVVGVAAMGPPLSAAATEAAGQLYQIHVLPGYWGRGIGSRLHAAFVDYLRENCLVVGQLEAWEHNTRGHAFYARHGWQPDGHRRPSPGPRGSSYLQLRLDLVKRPDLDPCSRALLAPGVPSDRAQGELRSRGTPSSPNEVAFPDEVA